MFINSNENWMRYSSTGEWKLSNLKDGGKWMFFYKERDFATNLINEALTDNIVTYAKHTKGNSGICCLYVSGTNVDEHRTVINFMLEHNLIRLTADIKYFDSNFKFNGQSWSKEFGPNFEGLIKLSDFIDLESGQPTSLTTLENKLKLTSLTKSKAITSNPQNNIITNHLDKFVIDYVNNLFAYQPTTTDLNDKLIFLAPKGYNLRTLYKARSITQFQRIVTAILSYYLQVSDQKQQAKIAILKNRASTDILLLINILETTNHDNHEDNPIDLRINDKFWATYQHMILTAEDYQIISYLLFLALANSKPARIDYIKANV